MWDSESHVETRKTDGAVTGKDAGVSLSAVSDPELFWYTFGPDSGAVAPISTQRIVTAGHERTGVLTGRVVLSVHLGHDHASGAHSACGDWE